HRKEEVKYNFFHSKITAAQEAGSYPLKGKPAVPADKIAVIYVKAKYIHPDVAADLEEQFAKEKHTEIPKIKGGQEYVPAPMPSNGQVKYRFFKDKIDDAIANGSYNIKGKRSVPANEIKANYGHGNKVYLHPNVAGDLEHQYAKFIASKSSSS